MNNTLTILGKDFTTTTWAKVAGKERVYFSTYSQCKISEVGYYDLNARQFVCTARAGVLGCPATKAQYIAAINEHFDTSAFVGYIEVAPEPATVAVSSDEEETFPDGSTMRDVYRAVQKGGGLHLATLGAYYDEM